MPFESKINWDKVIVISDDNYQRHASPEATPDGLSRGYVQRDYNLFPEGSFAAPFNINTIPRDQWGDRIEELERTKSRLTDLRNHYEIPSLNQNGTNYCWFNAVVSALTILRAKHGLPYVKLSCASGAAQIKNFRNQGGWGTQALEWIIEKGVCEDSIWPTNAIKEQYRTAEAAENAKKYKVSEWWELRNRNFNQLATCLLNRVPVPIGLNWWSHEVCALDLVIMDARRFSARPSNYEELVFNYKGRDSLFGVAQWNSWGDGYGDNGIGILTESKATADDQCAPRIALAA